MCIRDSLLTLQPILQVDGHRPSGPDLFQQRRFPRGELFLIWKMTLEDLPSEEIVPYYTTCNHAPEAQKDVHIDLPLQAVLHGSLSQ